MTSSRACATSTQCGLPARSRWRSDSGFGHSFWRRPTVDIGYNFGRPGKRRQSIDRLVCDARFGDEITQRIGRTGRVLGRPDTTQPSEAVVVVSDDAASELRAYD